MIQNREVELKVDSSITAQNALTFTNFFLNSKNLIKDINVEDVFKKIQYLMKLLRMHLEFHR
jgi:hypothetical protein